MIIILWSVSFLCLVIAVITSIGALQAEWFAVCLFCIAGMFSSAEYADKAGE